MKQVWIAWVQTREFEEEFEPIDIQTMKPQKLYATAQDACDAVEEMMKHHDCRVEWAEPSGYWEDDGDLWADAFYADTDTNEGIVGNEAFEIHVYPLPLP